MKGVTLQAVSMVALLTVLGCQGACRGGKDLRAIQQERDQLRLQLKKEQTAAQAERQYIAETTQVLNEVQDSVDEVRRDELKIVRFTAVADKEGWTRTTQKQEILNDIASIRQALRVNQDKLARLADRAEAANPRVASLMVLADKLRRTIAEQAKEIAALQRTAESLRAVIQEKEQVIRERDTVIHERDQEIVRQDEQIQQFATEARTGFVLVGTAEELKRLGVVHARRGLLGFRRHWQLARDLDSRQFRQIDIEEEREISLPIPLARVEVLSPHPVASFTLEAVELNSTVLRIKNLQSFWQFRFLVVLRKP
jgi:hypothetical protein